MRMVWGGSALLFGSMLAACGTERADADAGGSNGEPNPTGSSYDPCYSAEAGTGTATSLDFADERVATTVQLVQRHHEAPLFWEPIYRTDAVRMFEQGTPLGVDVTVLDVIRTEFVPAPFSSCPPRLTYYMNSEVHLATADGVLVGSLPMVLVISDDEGTPSSVYGTAAASFDDFVGTFDVSLDPLFAVDPDVELERTLGVTLAIGEERLYVSVQPNVSWPRPDGQVSSWSPGRGVTETLDCLGIAVPLDGSSDRDAELRRAWDDVARAWPSGPIAAHWGEGRSQPTEVTLSLGSPLRACFDGSDVRVVAPLSVSTADGSVHGTYELLTFYNHADGSFESSTRNVYMPVGELESTLGIEGVDFGAATHGQVGVFIQAAAAGERFTGALDVRATDAYEALSTGFPRLGWCVGEDCG